MTRPCSTTSLILHPSDPGWIPENSDVVIKCLSEMQFIGKCLEKKNNCFYAGEKFLDQISFMGCSPFVNFSPENTSEKFSYIHLAKPAEKTESFISKHTSPPRCNVCNKVDKNWRENLESLNMVCKHCGNKAPMWDYNWRKTAGFCRYYIEVTEIYPKEAIPQPQLLDQLHKILGTTWHYFYYFD